MRPHSSGDAPVPPKSFLADSPESWGLGWLFWCSPSVPVACSNVSGLRHSAYTKYSHFGKSPEKQWQKFRGGKKKKKLFFFVSGYYFLSHFQGYGNTQCSVREWLFLGFVLGRQGTMRPTRDRPQLPPLLGGIQTPGESRSPFASSKTRATQFPEAPAAEVTNRSSDSQPGASDPRLQTVGTL